MLHITEAYNAGVGRAIDSIALLTPDREHHLLWSARSDASPLPDFATATHLPDGVAARVRAVRDSVRRVKPDVVHAHSSWAGVYARVRPLDVPVVYQPHCYKFDDPSTASIVRRAYRAAERLLAARSDSVVVLSAHEARLALSLDRRVRVHVLTNAPTVAVAPARARVGDEVVMVGRLSAQKDPEHFARVAKLVNRLRPGTPFTWIGSGPTSSRDRLESAGVRVTGWLDGDRLVDHLDRAAVYYHSARYEGFPLSVLDAAARRVPVIARRIPAFDGTPLRVVDDEAAAARALVAVLDDEVERLQTARATDALHESMSIAAHVESLNTLYDRYTREHATR
ncbi:glycosyltransferase family 4 protein [Agromyces atrinae]|uniref:D-inositol 3-phosphate glycosyltransferase n=1 Tax=Agromyces atrinae TaxID=592376 RepID=A0A4Q2M2C1_9MICO|nr:glycosyltransferase family 4 protein [Agromyces atrinae]NYD68523.1 glycosyltransferase involved in cell wall biosynthesis [Agromyces atrinae]RXZ85908.1 glycosyltransferase [Agromyces atrinae]